MTTGLIIIISLVGLLLVVHMAVTAAELGKLRSKVTALEGRLASHDQRLDRHEEAIGHLIDAARQEPQGLLGLLTSVLAGPKRGLIPTLGVLATRFFTTYLRKRAQPELPPATDDGGLQDA